MPAAGDPAALGQLLRSRRERLTPAEAGLPADSFGGRRRRTAGLRREPHPTVVKGRRWDVLAANPAARELFADWPAGPPGELGNI
jgi:hypothetical protein